PMRVLGIDAAGGLLSWASTCWALVAGVVLAHRIAGSRAAWLMAAGFVGSPILLLVAGTPRVDTVLLAPIFVAMIGLWSSESADMHRNAAIAALMLGVAAGIKFHGIAFAALAAPFVLMLSAREGIQGQVRY